MDKICLVKGNDLCNNEKALDFIKVVAKKYNVPYWMIVGIMYHESKFGTAYHSSNKEDCRKNTNNWAGIKMNHTSEGTKKQNTIGPGCRLQKFDTREEGTVSLARTLGIGYKACMGFKDDSEKVRCVSWKYVGQPDVAEQTWIDSVLSFKQ